MNAIIDQAKDLKKAARVLYDCRTRNVKLSNADWRRIELELEVAIEEYPLSSPLRAAYNNLIGQL